MADEQTADTVSDKPLAALVDAEQRIEAPAGEPITAEQRLLEFENRVMGDAPRIDGKIERGIGSKFSNMTPEDRAVHAALERLVAAESGLVAAQRALGEAEDELAAAQIALDATNENVNAATE